ncbi:MAG: hypothetical protein LYZ69_07210 [Nitrososphaerales archaeon]|nr:hypothetical protein [Nitrososphaerales archaeon]
MKRRRLGQHYLVDAAVVARLTSLANIRSGERVLEIGTGKGALTKELCRTSSQLDGYEVDEENYRQTLDVVGNSSARIHLADAFEEKPEFDVLVSSLPYSRSASFVEWISQLRYDRAVVLLQEDFVKKVVSPPGSRDYRAISVVAQASSEISALDRVPRSAFSPEPKVNSVIVGMKPKIVLSAIQVAGIKRLFALRRREVAAVVAKIGGRRVGGWSHRRVYSLSPNEVLALVAQLQS